MVLMAIRTLNYLHKIRRDSATVKSYIWLKCSSEDDERDWYFHHRLNISSLFCSWLVLFKISFSLVSSKQQLLVDSLAFDLYPFVFYLLLSALIYNLFLSIFFFSLNSFLDFWVELLAYLFLINLVF